MKAVVIVGPTAAGKTDLSAAIAGERFEIVSADSVQVYRHLDIGSGKPSPAVRQRIPHHLIDCVSPDYRFTAGDFCSRATAACGLIAANGRVPLFVGGTGLYINAFFLGLSDIPPIDQAVKDRINEELDGRGAAALHEELSRVDPAFARRIHPNDRQRIARGLEVFRGLGRTISSYYATVTAHATDRTLFLGLALERAVLRSRIAERVDRMMADGFVEEVERLRSMGYGPRLNSMRSIGYAQINDLIDGRCEREDAVEKIKVVTAQYAKRQMTWFRKLPLVRWIRPDDASGIERLLREWCDKSSDFVKTGTFT